MVMRPSNIEISAWKDKRAGVCVRRVFAKDRRSASWGAETAQGLARNAAETRFSGSRAPKGRIF